MSVRIVLGLLLLLYVRSASAQSLLDDAYTALRAHDLETAGQLFERGLAVQPNHLIARKDYAYLLLKLGETAAARDQFGEAARQDPKDFIANLEYGFLCHETGQRNKALTVFDQVRKIASGDPQVTAERGFHSIDDALAAGIAQWSEAARQNPASDSVHEELAKLYEDRGEFSLAERHFAEAWQLKPTRRKFLLDLGRVRRAQGKQTEAQAAFVAASRSEDIRLSELAKEQLGTGDVAPEVIAASLALEPRKTFAAKRKEEISAITMADRSYQLGYMDDALRYYTEANEANPSDSYVQLRLGWVNNVQRRDDVAYNWFAKAKNSDDPAVSAEAKRAWMSLREQQATMRPTIWIAPMFSTRWHAGFIYGQSKLEFNKLTKWGVRPYVSLRFTGDTGATGAPLPLSERNVTPAVGVSTKPWHGIVAWAEGGGNIGRISGPDARAGAYHSMARGQQMGGESRGWFWQAANSANYASRFSNDTMFGTQQRAGYSWNWMQLGWLAGGAVDTLQQYWANYLETGPTIRIRLPWPSAAIASVDLVKGRNYVVTGNPRPPNYYDVRIGLWYAFTY